MNWCYDFKEKIGAFWYFSDYRRLGESRVYRSMHQKGGDDIKEVFSGSIDTCRKHLDELKREIV